MKKLRHLGIAIFMILIFLCGCTSQYTAKKIYEIEKSNMVVIVDLFRSNPEISGISRSKSFLYHPYSKIGKAYYERKTKEKINIDEEIADIVDELTEYVQYVYCFEEGDQFFVEFVTKSEFGYGESIVYTETGEQYNEKYSFIDERIDEYWYIAHSE